MDFVRKSVTAALVISALGCGGATEPNVDVSASFVSAPQEVVVKYGQDVQVGGGVLHIAFTDVEDSRCPTDVVCVWAGNAAVDLAVSAGSGPSYPLRVNSTLDPHDVEWQGVRLMLLEVHPEPRADTSVKKEEYWVKVRIEAAR